jgi:radical SAM protein with 4Fe4S-binding SPASM domain
MTNNFDFQSHPLVAIWEANSDLARPSDGLVLFPSGDKLELTDKEAEQMIRDLAELKPPVLVFAGADPLRRANICSLVQYAASCGLHPNMLLPPQSNLTRETIVELKRANLSRLTLVLNGGSRESHDTVSGVSGSFARTMQAIGWATECRLPVQIQTELNRRNLDQLEAIAAAIRPLRILGWNVSFPVPRPGEPLRDLPSATEFEEVFSTLYALAQGVPFKVKTAEAPHYKRFVLQQRTRARHVSPGAVVLMPFTDAGVPGVLPVNEGRAMVFISSNGEIFPSQGLRVSAGNVRQDRLTDVYRNSVLFDSLREPANLKGKCSECGFKEICGGSRGRAWIMTEDMFSEEHCCSYQPAQARKVI